MIRSSKIPYFQNVIFGKHNPHYYNKLKEEVSNEELRTTGYVL